MSVFGRLRVILKLVARNVFVVDSFCRKCGRSVRDFDAPDEVWRRVQPLIPFGGNTLCYECFVDLTRAAGLRLSNWHLVPLLDESAHFDEFTSS